MLCALRHYFTGFSDASDVGPFFTSFELFVTVEAIDI